MPYIGRPLQAGVRRRYIYAATAGQTSFSGNDSSGISLAYDDSLFLDVYQNGVLLKPVTDYASTTGTSVVLTTGASTDDVLEMLVFDTFGVADTVSAKDGGAFAGAVSMASTLAVTDDANFDSGTLFVDASANAVGIGETSPTSALHVKGGAGANVAIQSTSGSHWRLGDAVGASNGQFVLYDYTNSGGRILVNAGGEVNLPAQPAFSAKVNSDQTNLAVGSDVNIVFGAEIYDVGSNFASNTFTAPVTGKYQLSMMMYTQQIDSAATYVQMQISTSNRGYFIIFDPDFGQDATYWTFSLSILADMDANDTAIVQYAQSGGSAQTDVNANSYFTGALIC